MTTYKPYRCDLLFPDNRNATFFNDALGIESCIDYFIVSDACTMLSFKVMELDINMSDHRPVAVRLLCTFTAATVDSGNTPSQNDRSHTDYVTYLRWDHADLELYRNITEYYLRSTYSDILELDRSGSVTVDDVDQLYDRVVEILNLASYYAVPKRKKFFCKFWWDNDIDEMKERSIASCRSWKFAGKPHSGPIFEIYKKKTKPFIKIPFVKGNVKKDNITRISYMKLLLKNKALLFGSVESLNLRLVKVVWAHVVLMA